MFGPQNERSGDATANGAGEATASSPLLRAALLIAMIGPALIFVTLPPSLPLIAEYFGGGAAGRGVAQAAQASSFVGGVVGGLTAGAIVARLGLRQALIAAACLYALGGVVGAVSWTAIMLFAGCFAVGVTGSLLSSGLGMATGAVMRGDRRARMLGLQAASSDIAGVGIGLGAGFLAFNFGWRGPLLVYVVFGAAALALILASRVAAAEPARGERTGTIAVIRLAWPVYAASMILSILFGTLQLQLPFHLALNGIDSVTDRAIVQSCLTFAAACSSTSFSPLVRRLGERGMIVLGGAGAVAGFTIYAMWHGGLVVAALASALIGIAIGTGIPLLFIFALRRTLHHQHAYAIGLLNVTIFLGGAMSPLILGPIVGLAGYNALFGICAIIGGMGALVFRARLRTAVPSAA